MPLVLSPILRPAYNGVYLSLASIDIQNTHLLYMCLFTDKWGSQSGDNYSNFVKKLG